MDRQVNWQHDDEQMCWWWLGLRLLYVPHDAPPIGMVGAGRSRAWCGAAAMVLQDGALQHLAPLPFVVRGGQMHRLSLRQTYCLAFPIPARHRLSPLAAGGVPF